MTSIQPALDGTVPEQSARRQRAEDYETWLAQVWPKYIDAAASGRTFTFAEIAEEHRLPEPPDSHMWGRLATRLKEEGYTRTAGWAASPRPTVHHSGVRTWKGTAAARRAAA
ncbi:hypothetical protein ACFVZH_02480 [Streptomyces sp. NPDC059534]|uniref:hypothetical protein n=1 Tax=Streptomyces sp. NPDC059534 TaxID=3346859 RepID=UPI003699D93E